MSSDWAATTLRWWADAGVDVIVGESARDWLNPTPGEAPGIAVADQPTARPLPATLAEFQEWLMAGADFPGAAPSAQRLGPAGDPSAKLMVLTDVPALGDFPAGRLVSSDGLFDKMLGAIGLSRETIYLASLSPLRPPSGGLEAGMMQHFGDLARHHIGLVSPRAILLLGDVCARTLVGGAVSQSRSKWHSIETSHGSFRALVTLKPEQLNLQPNLKKHAWADLQLLKEGMEE